MAAAAGTPVTMAKPRCNQRIGDLKISASGNSISKISSPIRTSTCWRKQLVFHALEGNEIAFSTDRLHVASSKRRRFDGLRRKLIVGKDDGWRTFGRSALNRRIFAPRYSSMVA